MPDPTDAPDATIAGAATILHVRGATPETVEDALTTIFTGEERPRVLRLEGTFGAVLARATDPDLEAAYRYLVCRPHSPAEWVPVLELGNRTEGLDVALSAALAGAAVFTAYAYDDGLSGYRLARGGAPVDRYTSDPTYFTSEPVPAEEIEAQRGHPERFADLLPPGTAPEDFARVVLRPGWWEEYDAGQVSGEATLPASGPDELTQTGEEDRDEEGWLVDELDRMRCIALALELWGPADYPFARDLADIPNRLVGPAIALAYT
jgi:hypothetical protein